MALARLPLAQEQQSLVHDIIDECLVSSTDDIRTSAIAALHAFACVYLAPAHPVSTQPVPVVVPLMQANCTPITGMACKLCL